MPQTEWLREMVEEDLQVLFCDDEETVRDHLRDLIRRAREDMDLEERLIDLVDTSVELQNDDTMGSVWAVIALAEIPSPRATTVLFRALATESDELLQDAASAALLRLGASALEQLMEFLAEETSAVLRQQAYRVLGRSGYLADAEVCQRVEDFFESALSNEKHLERQEQALEELALAIADLGAIRLLDDLRQVLRHDFGGANVAIDDAVARLEDNENGVPFVGTRTPWHERYGWLFEDEPPEDDDEEHGGSFNVNGPFGGGGPELS